MKKGFTYHKLIAVFLLVLAGNMSFGIGLSGMSGKSSSSSNFTLKNLNKKKTVVLSPINSNYQFKGSQFLNVKKTGNTVQVNSVVRYQNGNTTYVFPYKYTVKAPLFKTPTAPAIR